MAASVPDALSLTCDVLVIGGGVAALRAAVAACEAGADVVVCCKGIAGRSGNTVVSTADISAYIPELSEDDSKEIFAQDTLASGSSIADDQLVQLLAERSGPAVLDLERLGIPLLRDGERIDRTRAAGHTRARTYRAASKDLGANKGLALSVPLAEKARALGARILDRAPVVKLLCRDGVVTGVVAVEADRDQVLEIAAYATIAASGGASHLFARTNGTADATGDIIALAMAAGAQARDMEFVQWHPTRMDSPVPLFLTNGLLADGAVFRDGSGREFMLDYDARGSLAPRDVLAKSIFLEAQSGRGIDGGVYLDCSGIAPDRITLRHAYLEQTLQKHGVDFPNEWVVVSPSTHFLMGGLVIDSGAASTLPGLFVAGETAGGIHGANRLGGNAFCEGLVFGTIAGVGATQMARQEAGSTRARNGDAATVLADVLESGADDPRPALTAMWQSLRTTMWHDASIVRDATSLGRARSCIDSLRDKAYRLRAPRPKEAARILEIRSALDCAQVIVDAAAARTESRGAHWRSDFPATSDDWFGHLTVRWSAERHATELSFNPKTPRPTRPG